MLKFEDVYKTLYLDIEIFYDYLSIQITNEKEDVYFIFECWNDEDVINLYEKIISKITRPIYHFSINFDNAILNAICKMVEKGQKNIIYKLRSFANMIIDNNLDYFNINKIFWTEFYFKNKDKNKDINSMELYNLSINQMKLYLNDSSINEFLNDFDYLLGKSKVYKELIINSVPKIFYYYTIRDNKLYMSISLKKLQLIHEGYNIKFDFNKYQYMEQIKKDGLYETFKEYAKNDAVFLRKLCQGQPLKDIKKRWYAYKALCKFQKVKLEKRMLFSENNTCFIDSVLSINNPDKYVDIDYTKFIKTPSEKFNNFVKFCNDHKDIKSDKKLKDEYCNFYQVNYIEDDYNITEGDNIATVINSFDEIKIGEVIVKFGLGGLHGALSEINDTNLFHLDYRSQYPSIIILFIEFFSRILNVNLYSLVYDGRMSEKDKNESDKDYDIIDGFKLILNMAYGLINSFFNLSISNKILGRFICLFGQSLLINLAYDLITYDYNIKLYNLNTDGIVLKLPDYLKIEDLKEVIAQNENDMLKLEAVGVKTLYQKDVNNYIMKKVNGKNSIKGGYNISIKQKINRHQRLSVNTENAVNLILNKNVKIIPIYFNSKWINKDEKAYYFTTEDKGEKAIKLTKKPEILTLNDNTFYFTDNIDDADLNLYKYYAEITKENILKFDWVNTTKNKVFFYEETIIKDTDENNKIKRREKRNHQKIFGDGTPSAGNKYIGLTGYKGDLKADVYSPTKGQIKPYINYSMSQILTSTSCQGLSLYNIDHEFIIIDIDIYDHKTGECKIKYLKNKREIDTFIKKLKNCNTFECWNNRTFKYNRKFIFKNPLKLNAMIVKKFDKLIECLDKATIKTFNTQSTLIYENNGLQPVEFNEILFEDIIKLY